MQEFLQYWPFLIPLIVLQLGLSIGAIVHILRHRKFKMGGMALWIVISCLSFIGPILYFAVGKADD